MFGNDGMVFKNDEGWNTLAEHVEVHNLYLNEALKYNVKWDDAVFSWYENIYTPLRRAMKNRSIAKMFPNEFEGDLYLAVSNRWLYLKERYENVEADLAAANYIRTNREKNRGIFSKVLGSAAAVKETAVRRPTAA